MNKDMVIIKAYGFPSIGFEQYRVESGLDQRLNQLLSFATGKTEDVSKIKAYEYAAENPLKVSQYLNADPQKRLELLPKGSNVYDATVRADLRVSNENRLQKSRCLHGNEPVFSMRRFKQIQD